MNIANFGSAHLGVETRYTAKYPCECESTVNVRPSTVSNVLSHEESYPSQDDGSRPPYRHPMDQQSWQRLYRGRTPERVPHSSSYSRNSSASSARSMTDERMEWANEERSRSASRPPPDPASPFTEASPYHPRPWWSESGALRGPHSLLPPTETSAATVIGVPGDSNVTAEEGSGSREDPCRVAESRYPTCI